MIVAMSVDLKSFISKIKVVDNCFHGVRDQEIANELYERHTLQSVLETGSDFLKEGKLKKGYEEYLVVLAVLIDKAPDEWINTFIDGFNDLNTSVLCISSLRSLAKFAEVPQFTQREYYVFEKEDFSGVSLRGYMVLNTLQALFKKIVLTARNGTDDGNKSLVNICYFCVMLISRHSEESLWTETETRLLAYDCLQCLMEHFGCMSVHDILVLDLKQSRTLELDSEYKVSVKSSVFGTLLQQWNPVLQRKTWRQHPVVAASFSWCVANMKFPHMSFFFELLLPPALLFVDDHMLENKEMGVKCLINIIQNTSSEELRWNSRAEVIYEALKLQMYRTEESLLRMTHEALLLILKVLTKNSSDLSTTTKYDELFVLILQSASHENNLVLRRVHTEKLHLFIEHLGIKVVKYLKRMIDLFEEYLEISDPPTEEARINILKAVSSFLQVAWPRIPAHSINILKILIKLLHQITSKNLNIQPCVKQDILSWVIKCLELLKAADRDRVADCLNSLKELQFSSDCLAVLNSVDQA